MAIHFKVIPNLSLNKHYNFFLLHKSLVFKSKMFLSLQRMKIHVLYSFFETKY